MSSLTRSVFQFANSGHNPRTTILLTNLRDDVTLASLKDSLKDIREIQKVKLQPGCALHYVKQEDASKSLDILAKLNYTARLENVSLPAVKVNSTSAAIQDLLKSHNPVSQISTGANDDSMLVFRATYRMPHAPEVDLSWINDAELKKAVSLVSSSIEGKPAVVLRNVSHLSTQQTRDILRNFNPIYLSFEKAPGVSGLNEAVTAVFPSDFAAMKCLATVHNSTVNGNKLKATLSTFTEYIVKVSGLPTGHNWTQSSVQSVLGRVTPLLCQIVDAENEATLVFANPDDADLAEILLNRSPVLNKDEKDTKVSRFAAGDFVVKFSAQNKNSLQQLQQELQRVFGEKSDSLTTVQSRHSTVSTFATLAEATKARNALLALIGQNGAELEGFSMMTTPEMDVSPAYAVSLTKAYSAPENAPVLGDDVSVSELCREASLPVPLVSHRNAIVKVSQHKDMLPALKALSGFVSSSGENATPLFGAVAPYRPIARRGDSEYDVSTSIKTTEVLDELVMERVSQVESRQSVAQRYEALMSEFERLLPLALTKNDATILFAQSNSVLPSQVKTKTSKKFQISPEISKEAQTLLEKLKSLRKSQSKNPTSEDELQCQYRLFDLFLMRADRADLAADIEQNILLCGRPDTSVDPKTRTVTMIRWASAFAKSEISNNSNVTAVAESEKEEKEENEEEGDDEAVASRKKSDRATLFSAMQVRDENGYVWHGTVMDSDMVQKTMPGKRVASHRALVVIGNMRGAAGFGSGKGKTPALAVEAAFRAALKNMTYIDLYENAGLAHDCFGQHNSCRAYITATPPSRLAVASPFAEAVLNAFGIGSASVKLIGRRNPYSMVNALFNALGKHENIDEYAKRRGKRYLTLKWLKDQKV